MRLSEAIVLGSTQTKLDPHDWDCCLIGMGFHALAGLEADIHCSPNNDHPLEAIVRWPWLENRMTAPVLLGWPDGHIASACSIISSLAVRVGRRNITFEQAVDWIRSVEPEEPKTATELDAEWKQELVEMST